MPTNFLPASSQCRLVRFSRGKWWGASCQTLRFDAAILYICVTAQDGKRRDQADTEYYDLLRVQLATCGADFELDKCKPVFQNVDEPTSFIPPQLSAVGMELAEERKKTHARIE